MNKAHQFASYAECLELMGALNKQGWISQWCPIMAFGKVYAKVWRGAGYSKITTAELQKIGAL